ncbi:MAG TPA: hypothetical protein VIP46_01580 [Pyrinomonadaceae bacterium]
MKVVMSTTRKRSRVTVAPVLFVQRRRIRSAPCGAFGSAVWVRTRAQIESGSVSCPVHAPMKDDLKRALRSAGPERFCGPGAPSCDCAPPTVPPPVETSWKSSALSSVSRGRPEASLRTKLYSVSMPTAALPIGAIPAPSRKAHGSTPCAQADVKPAASSRFGSAAAIPAGVERLTATVLKTATPESVGMSPE